MSVGTRQSTSPRNQHAAYVLRGCVNSRFFKSIFCHQVHIKSIFSNALKMPQKSLLSSSCLSFCPLLLDGFWWNLMLENVFWKSVERIQILSKSDRINGHFIGRMNYFVLLGATFTAGNDIIDDSLLNIHSFLLSPNHNSCALFSKARLMLPK